MGGPPLSAVPRGEAHRLPDLGIGAAPAEVARQVVVHVPVARLRVLGQQGASHHDEPGRAVPALVALGLPERAAHRVVRPQSLQGQHVDTLRPGGPGQARADRPPVDEHRARPARPHAAALPDAEQPQTPERVQQQLPVPDLDGDGRPVDPQGARGHVSSASTTRSGVIGSRVRRTPSASRTALPIAGAVARIPVSPTPLAPNGPSRCGDSTSTIVARRGVSLSEGTWYVSRLPLSRRPASSTTSSSNSAWASPISAPPYSCWRHSLGLIARPTSPATARWSTRTRPVPRSTTTSAPAAVANQCSVIFGDWPSASGASHSVRYVASPVSVVPSAPSPAANSSGIESRGTSSPRRPAPPRLRSSPSAGVSSSRAAISRSCARTRSEASRTALPMWYVEREPAVIVSYGVTSVSGCTIMTRSGARPRTSAQIWPMIVSLPWPMSTVPMCTLADASALSCTTAPEIVGVSTALHPTATPRPRAKRRSPPSSGWAPASAPPP